MCKKSHTCVHKFTTAQKAEILLWIVQQNNKLDLSPYRGYMQSESSRRRGKMSEEARE